MYTDFDEMDIEPNAELAVAPPREKSPPAPTPAPVAIVATPVAPAPVPAAVKEDSPAKIDKSDEELQSQLLTRTVPLDDGSIGYVFTCTKNGPLATWRCHACNFVDSWKNLVKHIESNWHEESMSNFQHSRSNFTKVENAIPDISKGQPLPPGMEDDVITGPCQLWKTLEKYDQPLIGLEFLLELQMMELKEPRYLCLLCDKRGDPRSILVHLTSQSHYLIYLRKYFKSFHALIDKLPKSNECRGKVSTVTAHLVAKLEEKYGRLQPTASREEIINTPEQRTIILQKIDSGIHFVESPEDKYLEEMLTVEYVQNTTLLLKNFPLKPKMADKSRTEENSKSMFNKGRRGLAQKQLRSRKGQDADNEEPDVVFISKKPKHDSRGRELSPRGRELSPRSRSRSYRSSRSPPPDYRRRHMSPSYYRSSRHRSRSPRRRYSRSPHDRRRSRSPVRAPPPPSRHGRYRVSPERYYKRTPSPDIRSIYGPGYRGHSRGRTPPGYRGHSRGRSPHRPREKRKKYRLALR